ncbi:MAG: NAD(P)-binding domain-containing protein [Ferruginibacter sp.]
MKIALIGSGNVATVIGRLIMRSNHTVTQVISRDKLHAKELADELNAAYNDFTGPLSQDADIIIIAVADSSIDNLFSEGIKNDKIVVHTAGAVSMEVLQPY